MPGRRKRRSRPTPWSGHRVEVDVVRHRAVVRVQHRELHEVALAHADEVARHLAAEGPEGVVDAVGEAHGLLDALELDLDPGGVPAGDRGRHGGGEGDLGHLLADELGEGAHRHGSSATFGGAGLRGAAGEGGRREQRARGEQRAEAEAAERGGSGHGRGFREECGAKRSVSVGRRVRRRRPSAIRPGRAVGRCRPGRRWSWRRVARGGRR